MAQFIASWHETQNLRSANQSKCTHCHRGTGRQIRRGKWTVLEHWALWDNCNGIYFTFECISWIYL